MLRGLNLINFRAHKKTELEFSPGLNVITGPSDSGKSAITGGFLWVKNNRPLGDEVQNWDANERDRTSVEISFTDGVTIGKERYKGKSKYIIGKKELEAVKQDVPEEISSIINMNEYNLQEQHQSYFFLNETPGERARQLNELVGLDIIDTIFKNLDSRIRRVNSDIKSHQSDIKTLQTEIKDLEYADDLYESVLELEEQINEWTSQSESLTRLQSLIEKIEEIEEELQETNFPSLEAVISLLSEIKDYQESVKEFESFRSLLDSLEKLNEDITIETDWLECTPLYLDLSKVISTYSKDKESNIALERTINLIETEENSILYEKKKLDKLLKEYMEKIKEAKVCPFCFSSITNAAIERIVKEL